MRKARMAFLVTGATALVFAGRLALSARMDDSVISACVQNASGSMRFGSNCKNSETLVQWNVQGPQGPQGVPGAPVAPGAQGHMGPQGPAGTGGSGGGLRILDNANNEVGQFQAPGYAVLTINSTIVFTNLDITAQSFQVSPPVLYYTDTKCTSSPMLYLDMTHFGYVDNTGTLWYPTGPALSVNAGSINYGLGCFASPATGAYAAIAKANVSSFVAPFHLSH